MKFIVDAQLQLRLARELVAAGHDAVHTINLARGNRTPDAEITSIATAQNRVVVTKDVDSRSEVNAVISVNVERKR
jgi:predicted nuclease of predicted toxin-antitoxin system